MTATDVVDKKLKLGSPRKIYIGYPGGNYIQKPSGWITPNVFSWIVEGDDIYWMFYGAQNTYMKHDPADVLLTGWGDGFTNLDTIDTNSTDFGIDFPSLELLKIPRIVKIGFLIGGGLLLYNEIKKII